ncbi:MAG: malto-oligosyltrehalose trehalohydrolase [Chloroflexi bacterium]|nr:malto-oligosyltrehalose trehalohydrolase [Chloroflexota bacterium]
MALSICQQDRRFAATFAILISVELPTGGLLTLLSSERLRPTTSVQIRPGLGAKYLGQGQCQFVVWAPYAQNVDICLAPPGERRGPMEAVGKGYHHAVLEGVQAGSLYRYRLDGQKELPDPASRFQPQGVHGPSQVVDLDFAWEDGCWFGLPLQDYILYELHVGAFTAEGTFEALIPHLDYLKNLGITALEIMPVGQFPGDRNWGYDGVYPFAVQNTYGGPTGLKKLVNACHHQGLAVVLDVVYNHLGPEGNYLRDFGPYFTDRYRTPWGPAINLDGSHSDEVRHFFVENALFWITEFHIDALRLDAIHAIFDRSARPFLSELAEAVQRRARRLNRRAHLIAESDLNDARIILPRQLGGYGLDAQWSDDFHHALHTVLTGERTGYYRDFGEIEQLSRAFRDGYVYTGQYSPNRQHRHGNSPRLCPAHQFVVSAQTHDQVGNRVNGDRLSQLIRFEGLKLAAGAVLLSPFVPLLFMGEEYGESAPFPYFISHLDPGLVDAVRRGRREEFAAFAWLGEPPDPQDEATFRRAKLDHRLRRKGQHRVLLDFYRELTRLRKTVQPLASLSKEHLEARAYETERMLYLHRWSGDEEVILFFNFNDAPASATLPIPTGRWRKALDSSDRRWRGSGSRIPEHFTSPGRVTLPLSPLSLVLFHAEGMARRGFHHGDE